MLPFVLRSRLSPYALAIGATAAALFARWLLEPQLSHRLPFATIYAAIAIAVWFGGWRPALLTAVLGFVCAHLLFIETEEGTPLTLASKRGITAMALYAATSALVIGLGSAMRSARSRSETAAAEALQGRHLLEREITDRRRTESQLRAKENELAQVMSQTPLLLIRCTKDRRYAFVNDAGAAFLGRRKEDIVGQAIQDVIGAAAAAAIEPFVARVLAGESVEFEREIPYSSRGPRVMHATYTPDRDAHGDVIGWFATIEDVSAHRHAEQALVASEARLAAEARTLGDLNALSSRLWRMPNLRQGLEETLAAAIALVGADMGNLQVLDEDSQFLRIAVQRGFRMDFLEFFKEVSIHEDSACSRALRMHQRVVIPDVEADAAFAPLVPVAREAGYRAVQSTPLLGRNGAALGVLSTHWRSVRALSEQEASWLDLYAHQAANFIERSRSDEALREADRRKDEFLATLAHELRNPLAPVRNAVEILRMRGAASPELQWAQGVIDRQVQQMSRLIDDLMDVSRITRNRMELRKERVDLGQVIHGAVETARPLIDGRGHRLGIVLPREPVPLDADPTRVAQVFANLLNNAAKYSEPGTPIELDAHTRDGEVVVSVRDQGVGIPADVLPHVFDGFARAHPWPQHRQGGLGIGLALVKRLVEMHGGSVTARSGGEGAGSEFVVRLPVARDDRQPHERADAALVPAPAGCRVVVADDNRDAADSLARMLAAIGYETRTAHDGNEALEVAAAFHPRVMLLDLGMPNANGYEVARRIRTHAWGKDTVLVAITGWGQDADRQRTAAAGFDHHLVKPVDAAALSKLLASFVRQ